MKRLGPFLSKAAASCFYLSYLPELFSKRSSRYTGAGFIGSVAGLLTARVLPVDVLRLAAVLLGALLVAVAVSDDAEELMGRHDDPRIVIDEWVGMWFTLALVPMTKAAWVTGLILFRCFDTFKMPWVRRLALLPGGWGIVLDDVLAGLMANALLRLIFYIHPL